MRILVTIISLCVASLLFAQQESSDVRRGNKQYNDSNYTEAEVNYRRGLEKNNQSFEGHFNLGDALFRQEKYPEALEQYAEAEKLLKADESKRKEQLDSRLAATYHNMGNALYAQQQYDKAVGAYQQSLRLNPKDHDTRYNLVKAMQQLQQQQNQQQNQDQQQEQQQQNDSTQQQQQQEQQQNQQQQPDEQQMDKETAEQILQALEQDEQETQEKLQRQQGKKRRVEKEW
ncbi:MAG: tetratricopeptide repeat protein [Paludibacteraceae bacterium]|nr:tetratricopeptide repeat protein [Paludibacteraceae bacterium]